MSQCLSLKISPYQIIRSILVGEIVQNNQKIVFFMLFWGIWAPPKGPKKVIKGPQVDRMYVPMSKLENKPLVGEIVQNNKKIIFFYVVLGHLGTPNEPKKVLKGPKADMMYAPMLKLENKPLTK
jgi:hypothetical protein